MTNENELLRMQRIVMGAGPQMDLSALERPALEQYAANLDQALDACEAERARYLIDNEALRNAIGDIEQLAQHAVTSMDLEYARWAASLARLVRLDRSNLENDE